MTQRMPNNRLIAPTIVPDRASIRLISNPNLNKEIKVGIGLGQNDLKRIPQKSQSYPKVIPK